MWWWTHTKQCRFASQHISKATDPHEPREPRTWVSDMRGGGSAPPPPPLPLPLPLTRGPVPLSLPRALPPPPPPMPLSIPLLLARAVLDPVWSFSIAARKLLELMPPLPLLLPLLLPPLTTGVWSFSSSPSPPLSLARAAACERVFCRNDM